MLRAKGRRFLIAGALLAVGLRVASCGGKAAGRVIVLGLDGMDPQTVDLLISEGKLPNFAEMRKNGAYGRLESMKPFLSPVIWTTIATGKTPDLHGIGHFVAIDPKSGENLPVTSQMRRVKALWNILSENKKKVGVIGYWATWPAETVNGFVVSDHTCYHFLFPQGENGAKDEKGLTYPPELLARITPLIRRPGDITMQEAAPYIQVTPTEFSRPFNFEDDISHFKWALATADSYRQIGLKLWKEEKPDVMFAYTEGTDSIAHLFGHLFRAGSLSGELLAQQKKFGNAVEQMYLYADNLVGQYMKAMDSDTTLVVLSDHGFDLGASQDDPSKTRDLRRVSEHFHKPQGILYMYGSRVRRGRLDDPKILDITPTLLALSGIAPARDMPGRVLTDGLDIKAPTRTVATFETGPGQTSTARDGNADPQIMERLRSLGYVGGADKAAPGAPAPGPGQAMRSPQGDRNLAAVNFEEGHYKEAAEIYSKLLKDDPKDAALHTSLAGALGAMGRYDEAVKELDLAVKIEPLNVEAYHNRAVIFERQGKKEAAIEQYRTAIRYAPEYAPSRQALMRLTGSADVRAPRSDAEKRAATVAEAASQAAKHGDYQEAMKRLDEAEKIAPQYTIIYQYRANVAYLMGDFPGAEKALERALQIEPDNALFRNNLKRLREQATKGKK